MKPNDFVKMLEHADPNDVEEMRDILTMMAQEVGKQGSQIKKLTTRLNRINAMYQITALPKSKKA